MKTLRDVKVGESAEVKKLHDEGAVKRRIMDMGITKGVDRDSNEAAITIYTRIIARTSASLSASKPSSINSDMPPILIL